MVRLFFYAYRKEVRTMAPSIQNFINRLTGVNRRTSGQATKQGRKIATAARRKTRGGKGG